MRLTKRQLLKTAATTAVAGALPTTGIMRSRSARAAEPVKLGILHSLTGSIAIAEIGS
jgi:urea transport system substrate-binding protein